MVDDDFEAIRAVSCDRMEETHLPMDETNNHKSFEELLKIDVKARTAIAENNDKVLKYVVEIHQKTKGHACEKHGQDKRNTA